MTIFNLAWKFFMLLGVVFVGMGLYFLLIRPAFIMQPEDVRVAKLTGDQIKSFSPDLFLWLTFVIRAWGSFCLGFGTLVIGVSLLSFRKKEKWSYYLLTVSILPLLLIFFAIQYAMKGDFYIPLAIVLIISLFLFAATRKHFAK